jgi:hypothetical protein
MNKQGYIKIMSALVNLMVTIMVEAGKVPMASAKQVGEAVLKAATGGGAEKK